MSKIEKMQRYIERTGLPADPHDNYCLVYGELDEIWKFSQADIFRALCLLFEYGKAKGYRAAKAERRAAV